MKLVAGGVGTVSIVGVDHEDETLRVLVIMPPQRSDLILSSHIPHGEADVLVFDGLHVEADGWDGRHHLAQLELVEDGGLTGGVETNLEVSVDFEK